MATGTWTRRLTRSTFGGRRDEDEDEDEDAFAGEADDDAVDPDDVDPDVDDDVDGGVAVVMTLVAGGAAFCCWRNDDERDFLEDRPKNFIVDVDGLRVSCYVDVGERRSETKG